MRNFAAYHWYYAGKAWIVCSKGALLAKSWKLVWSSGGGKFTGPTSRFGNVCPTSLITRRTSLGSMFVSHVVQIVTLMFHDTRSLKVEAVMACCTFPDRRNLERKTRCKTAMLVFIFPVKLSYPPRPALLYITCHILLVWLSVARTVMMWGGKKSTVSCGTSLGGQYEMLLRWSPVGWGICIFVTSTVPLKSIVTLGICALPWFKLTRYTIIKMIYPLVLQGWNNCVQTQSLLHSYWEPNRLLYNMRCRIFSV